ncbi:MAG: DUF1987 domain-containing protein [Sphingobacteriia bacterium]|jgi:hypothetical protein
MRNLVIEPTDKTPKVVFDAEKSIYVVEGRSIPEDSAGFYRKVYSWLDQYGTQLTHSMQVEMKLEYFNTSSSKCILDMFRRLEKLHEKTDSVQVVWYAEEEDEDLVEAGEDYSRLVKVPFEVVKTA